ncbi:MAG: GGDEF domain-containing protein [Lachnospiraceae bacterium]|nr:GGDEF domain-containing protein [Lachnospiraceae bacterium]
MKFSLRAKVICFVGFMILIIASAGVLFNRAFITKVVTDTYRESTQKVAGVVASVVDPQEVYVVCEEALKVYRSSDDRVYSDKWGSPEFEAYVSQYSYIEDMDEYKDLLEKLQEIQKASGAKGIYLAYYDSDARTAIYLVDGSTEDVCPVGCLDSYEEAYSSMNPNMEEKGIAPYETKTEAYGWLMTAGMPIRYDGKIVAYAYADLSMDRVEATINMYSRAGVLAIVVCLSAVLILGLLLLNAFVVSPINSLSAVASQYHLVEDELGGLGSNGFRNLDIKSGDEIEVLANSLKKMESDLNDQIENLFATRQELISTREHADIMNEIANRDALTGIRNKRGYETEIQRINKGIVMGNNKVGVVMVDMNDLKKVNDNYGHEKGDKVICSLCDILCSIFKRSPVFRIGGDEFVVIVSNYDYTNLESNVDKFKACIEHNMNENELEPWERASAAIGYAIFDAEQDIAIEDTLKRADESMYKCKEEMKKKYNLE